MGAGINEGETGDKLGEEAITGEDDEVVGVAVEVVGNEDNTGGSWTKEAVDGVAFEAVGGTEGLWTTLLFVCCVCTGDANEADDGVVVLVAAGGVVVVLTLFGVVPVVVAAAVEVEAPPLKWTLG